MEALYLLIPLSVILVALALWIFFGAAESGQFEDLEGPGMRILVDDDSIDAADAPVRQAMGERVGGAGGSG